MRLNDGRVLVVNNPLAWRSSTRGFYETTQHCAPPLPATASSF